MFLVPSSKVWIALLSVAVVAAMVWLVGPWVQRRRHTEQLLQRLAALDACVAGGGPRDDATLRRRRIAAETSADAADWPARCDALAAETAATLATLRGLGDRCDGACCQGDDGCATLDALAAPLAALRGQLSRGRFEGEACAELWSRASRIGALATDAAKGPPAPVVLPDPQTLTPLSARLHDSSALWARPDGGWTLLLHSRDWQLTLCDIAFDATARCRSAPASLPVRGTVLLVDGALHSHPHVLVQPDPDAEWSVFDATSGAQRLGLSREPIGVTVLGDGVVHALVRDDHGMWLVDSLGGEAPLALSDALGPPLLFADTLLWPAARDGAVELRQRALGGGEESVALSIAEWRPSALSMQACSDSSGLAVWLVGDAGTATAKGALAFRSHEGWSLAMAAGGDGGLACQAGAITITAIAEHEAGGGSYALWHERCDRGGCALTRGEAVLERFLRSSRYVAASLGERLLLAWRSPLGDVRMRRGAPNALQGANTQPLFDDEDHGGFAWEHEAAESFARDGRALLLTPATHRGAYAVFGWLVDDGDARPISVSASGTAR